MRPPNRRGRAFMLVNMLIVLGLLGAFAVLAERVARLSLQIVSKTTTEQDDLIRLERALYVLREDVWNAASVETIDQSHLRITGDRAIATDWQTIPTGDLMRTEKAGQQRWADLGLEFERQGGWLVVRRRGAEVALFQQGRTAGGNR